MRLGNIVIKKLKNINLKILLLNDTGIPVPPKLYGDIERIVFQLANEYTRLGHDVTLLDDSQCNVKTSTVGTNDLNNLNGKHLRK